ncbi:cell division protein FtsQ/DivIB [Tardiphaga alba]|uniref:Cell division protein FtsQ n=1 Tax=Tardiphaga alba TaxID=340268 RepID=A0ABX8A5J9_9BRAD|nr:cell division protein FtsQ/DivIB [Tardiphaga alba]QUS38979.1 cell division protein FtsQ/DivIB [Tardiphaga alba]
MDGGGRLSRSVGSLRPQADLKMAARGAGILLRERLAPLERSVTALKNRKAPAREPSTNKLVIFIERYVPRRVGIAATLLMLAGSVGFGVVKGEHVDELVAAFQDTRNAAANAAGFRISSVILNGRKQLTQDEILAIGGINGRSSLLFVDAAAVREKLKANPWIADANVLKLYPDRLQIDVTERTAFALWQEDGKLAVIADDGAVLENFVPSRFVKLPLVVGKGADVAAKDFIALLDRYPQVRAVTKAAIYVGERRWNLRLNDNLDVRLPENDVGNALAMLSKLDRDDRLFSRDIVAIDMRLPDRLTVRLSEEAAKARDEQFKAQDKAKKKAGAA